MGTGVPVTRAVRKLFWDHVRAGLWAGDAGAAAIQ
jgi:hypothetical protein